MEIVNFHIKMRVCAIAVFIWRPTFARVVIKVLVLQCKNLDKCYKLLVIFEEQQKSKLCIFKAHLPPFHLVNVSQ